MNLIKQHKIEILENAFSYMVVLAMLAYGFGKLVQFNGAADIDMKVSEMTGMQLMWAFYGYSKPFVLTLGALEIIGGILMLLKRTRLIGCLFVSTILINIILQDIFYGVNIGALRAAIIYQILIITILYINRAKIIKIWKILINREKRDTTLKNNLLILLISGILFIIFRILEYYITIKW